MTYVCQGGDDGSGKGRWRKRRERKVGNKPRRSPDPETSGPRRLRKWRACRPRTIHHLSVRMRYHRVCQKAERPTGCGLCNAGRTGVRRWMLGPIRISGAGAWTAPRFRPATVGRRGRDSGRQRREVYNVTGLQSGGQRSIRDPGCTWSSPMRFMSCPRPCEHRKTTKELADYEHDAAIGREVASL